MPGLPWIPLDVTFPGSRKSVALGIALKEPLAWAYVVRIWTWCAQHAADGRVEGPDAVAVLEHAAGWHERPGELVAAMSLPHIRLLDETSAGFAVHDWDEHCGAHVEKRERERKRINAYRYRTRTERVQNEYVRGERERESNTESDHISDPATINRISSVGGFKGGNEAEVITTSPAEWRKKRERKLAAKTGITP